MIIFDLKCQLDHKFEAWFKDAAAFEEQKAYELVQCPHCGTSQIEKMPSGFHIKSAAPVAKNLKTQESPVTKPNNTQLTKKDIDHLDPIVVMKAVKKYVEDNFENVGKTFAEKAIKMQNGEIKPKPIYGSAHKEDLRKLDDAEVAYMPLPKLPEQFDN